MASRLVPFWREQMSAEEQAEQARRLVAMIPVRGAQPRTYIFAPDPPPLPFEAAARQLNASVFNWGPAGRGAACPEADAPALARAMFELWPDTLYVAVFDAAMPAADTLARWTEAAVNNVEVIAADSARPRPPLVAMRVFDWGDLVEDIP